MIVNYDLLRVLCKIQDCLLAAGAVETVVSGGAIRDMLLGRPIKDIDVFYVGNLDEDKLLMLEKQSLALEDYEGTDFQVTHPHLRMDGCDYPIQLMKVDVPEGQLDEWILDNFGCNLSKVGFGEHLEISQQFLDDVEMEMMTFPKPVSEKYMKKMTDKYPDFLVNGTIEDECSDF